MEVLAGVCDLDVSSDVPHTYGASGCTDHEQIASAGLVDQNEEPDESAERLYDAEDTGCEKGGGCADNTDALKDGRGVVVLFGGVSRFHGREARYSQ